MTGEGVSGACEGETFVSSPPDLTGMVTFRPSRQIVLQPFGDDRACAVRFAFDVLASPRFDRSPLPEVQTVAAVRVQAASRVLGVTVTSFGEGSQLATVRRWPLQ